MQVTGLVNNTHLLRETVPEIILEGHEKALALSRQMDLETQILCAVRLELPHPITGAPLMIRSAMDANI